MLEYDLDPQGWLRLLYGMRLHRGLWLASFQFCGAALLAGCGSMNVVSWDGDSNLMLRGRDPVAYFTQGKPTPGLPGIKAQQRGATYRFASEENWRQFITDPELYAPQFGGFSANGMVYAIPVVADADSFKIIDGKLYLFESERTKLYFEMHQEANLKRAWYYWDTEVKDGNWGLQAVKRQFLRVPDYKSDAELAEEYEKRSTARTR
jgi:YHS domain-containing protein